MKIVAVAENWASKHSTFTEIFEYAKSVGHEVDLIDKSQSLYGLGARMTAFNPDRIHICIDGSPFSWLACHTARKLCGYTSSMSDPELSWMSRLLHKDASRIFYTSEHDRNPTQDGLAIEFLEGCAALSVYERTEPDQMLKGLAAPRFIYMGPTSKNYDFLTFLSLKLPGTKVVIGQDIDPVWLHDAFPKVYYVRATSEAHVARILKACDTMVCTNTSGISQEMALRASAAGISIAGYPSRWITPTTGRSHASNLYIAAMEACWMKQKVAYPKGYEPEAAFSRFIGK